MKTIDPPRASRRNLFGDGAGRGRATRAEPRARERKLRKRRGARDRATLASVEVTTRRAGRQILSSRVPRNM